jgi:hypothetical protein
VRSPADLGSAIAKRLKTTHGRTSAPSGASRDRTPERSKVAKPRITKAKVAQGPAKRPSRSPARKASKNPARAPVRRSARRPK